MMEVNTDDVVYEDEIESRSQNATIEPEKLWAVEEWLTGGRLRVMIVGTMNC